MIQWSNFRSDHTETIDIEFDPEITTYDDLLKIFWNKHSPTSQRSAQYMSAIFYHDQDQLDCANKTLRKVQSDTVRQIVTKIMPAKKFYNAEK